MKHLFRTVAFILLLLFVLSYTSCSPIKKLIGENEEDYSEEWVIGSKLEDEAVISELSNLIGALTINSIKLTEFSDTKTALSLFEDSLLNHLLTTGYSRFSGNTETLQKAAKEYPNLNITAAISTSDYEGALYKYFNHGGNIRHEGTSRFKYLSKIKAYTPAVQAQANNFELDIVSIDETQSTYRMTFYCTDGKETSPEYLAIFVKREKNGCYIKSLEQIASEKVSYNVPEVFS
ncbi:MAG: hypothetical protein IKT56_06680 [Clostridia bacterium]|nr:hypothetical protein [Clostridia bacterium]